MAEFSGFKCDGPECGRTVNKKDEESRKWLRVSVANDGYKEEFTFCSYDCFEQQVHEVVLTQHSAFE